jgi:ribulose-5-phosphate 4-epimerase/fuculose-1-phosphate aldolase
MNRNDATLNPGTNDFTIQAWITTPASVATGKIIANQQTASLGWQLAVNDDSIRANIKDGSVIQAKPPISANTNYYIWVKWDRDGNCVAHLYSPSGLVADTVDISSLSASNLNPVSQYIIGAYAPLVTTSEWDGGLTGLKWDNDELLSDQQLVEDAFLAENWKSGGGNVYRDSFGFHQMVLNTGKDVLTVGLKGGTQSAMDVITSDSTRYTMQFSGIISLFSDSLIFVAGGDSVWHALSDSTFAANRGLQVVFDAWTSTRFTAPTGDWATIDNITVSTYALAPEISVNPTSYDYGNITVNDSDSVYVKIVNTGDGSLSVTDINWITAAQIAVNDTDFTISANDSDSVLVYFKPQSAGAKVDTLTIVNNDADESNLEVPLAATGVAVSSAVIEKRKLFKYNSYPGRDRKEVQRKN